MFPSRALLDGSVCGFMIGWATSQWLNNPSYTIWNVPARIVYVFGGLIAVLVLLLTWLECRWEEP